MRVTVIRPDIWLDVSVLSIIYLLHMKTREMLEFSHLVVPQQKTMM